jgi:RNA polymerase sigma factor (sigma-70 family)
MEAARTLDRLPERLRRRRFTAACEELRPLGIAYVLRHFSGALDRADAEDVVAEVIIRFDRLDAAARPPERLRPAFFQSVRNAALDLLRYRGVRPTAPLEAAATRSAEAPDPEERAESHQDVARLREAMARMNRRYREAVVLRFGLGLTVPQIAERLAISLPAAKKLVLRSTAQIRDRMEAIDGREFCPEMRGLAERSVLDGEIAALSSGPEAAAIKAHLEHCGPCRGFLAALRSNLHELGSGALLAGVASGRLGLLDRLHSALHAAGHAAHLGAARVRLASYRAGGAFAPEGAGSAGLLAGTGQRLAAACTAGAAGAATCLATGIVGPGIALGPSQHIAHRPTPPAAHVRKAPVQAHRPLLARPGSASVPEEPSAAAPATVEGPRPRGSVASGRQEKKTPEPHKAEGHVSRASTPSETEQSQFGIEEEEAAPAEAPPAEEAPPVAESRSVETTSSAAGSSPEASSAGGGGGAGSGGQEEFGFGG